MTEDGTAHARAGPQPAAGRCIPKLIGSDVELGNLILGRDNPLGTGEDAARLLLERIDGCPRRRGSFRPPRQSQSISERGSC